MTLGISNGLFVLLLYKERHMHCCRPATFISIINKTKSRSFKKKCLKFPTFRQNIRHKVSKILVANIKSLVYKVKT